MAYYITQEGDESDTKRVSVVINSRADLDTLPTYWAPGSDCLCIGDSTVYILTIADETTVKEWKEI